MINALIRGPIHFDDLNQNTLARGFLTNLSTPIRYVFGLAVGLFLGALYPENLASFGTLLLAVSALAIIWVALSLIAKSVMHKALTPLLDDDETLKEYQLMHSKSWIAAVKVKEA